MHYSGDPLKILVVGQITQHRTRLIDIDSEGNGQVCDALKPTPSGTIAASGILYNGRPTLCAPGKSCTYYSNTFEKWQPYGSIDRLRRGAASANIDGTRFVLHHHSLI